MNSTPAIWFPTIHTNTGTDIFTKRLVKSLNGRGIQAEITWLPLRAEYAPWSVPVPKPPEWANVTHINTWLHPRFIPSHLPVVATIHHAIHHSDVMSYKGWLRAAYHKYWIALIERRVMRRAEKTIAVSQFVAATAKQMLLDIPMQVIYNGVDTDFFKPSDRVRRPDDVFRLLYVGSWKKLKGVDLLAPIMRELGKDFELLYTGGAASNKDKPNMPSNMRDIGRLQGDAAIVATMQKADALLFPSRSEGHPLVSIEAMACGLPVVAMNSSSVVEVVKHGINGYLCECNSTQSFVDALRALQKSPPLQKKMMLQARTDTVHLFSTKSVTKQYLDCYESLV